MKNDLKPKNREIAVKLGEWTDALQVVSEQYDVILTEIRSIRRGTDEIVQVLTSFGD